ncbi:hypothetical protein ACVWZZ_001796 [Bradyrhizobium sp. LM6.10]
MFTPVPVGGTIEILSGNGQSGLVGVAVTRVSSSRPISRVTACASTRGCAAMARIGFISSQSDGSAAEEPEPCSAIERQALAHCTFAFSRSEGSLRMRSETMLICSPTFLSISGFTCAGTLTLAPATLRLVSPRLTWAPRLGSRCQLAASFGREVTTTLPLISALAFRFLMLTAPIRFAASPPSTLPSASPSAPVAFDDSEPVTFSLPLSGVEIVSTSLSPAADIGPRTADQPMSASCRICEIGFSALPAKLRGAAFSACSRIADSAMATGATTIELFATGGSGGNCATGGAEFVARGDSQSIAFRLTKNDAASTTTAISTVFKFSVSRINPPGRPGQKSTGQARRALERTDGVELGRTG